MIATGSWGWVCGSTTLNTQKELCTVAITRVSYDTNVIYKTYLWSFSIWIWTSEFFDLNFWSNFFNWLRILCAVRYLHIFWLVLSQFCRIFFLFSRLLFGNLTMADQTSRSQLGSSSFRTPVFHISRFECLLWMKTTSPTRIFRPDTPLARKLSSCIR